MSIFVEYISITVDRKDIKKNMIVKNHLSWYKFIKKSFNLDHGFDAGLKDFNKQFPHLIVKEVANIAELENYYHLSRGTFLTYVNIYSRGNIFTTWVINGYSEETYIAMSGFQ